MSTKEKHRSCAQGKNLIDRELAIATLLLIDSLYQTIAAIEEKIEPQLNDWFTCSLRPFSRVKIFSTALQFLCCTIASGFSQPQLSLVFPTITRFLWHHNSSTK